MRNYTVHFLDDKEFEALPYKDTDSSLGLADTHTRQAYVRRTGVNVLDMHTAMHELEHLEEGKEGVHAHHEKYGDGVYYKGFGEVVSTIAAPVLGLINPFLGAAAGIGGQLFGARDQAKQQQAMQQQQQQQAAQYSAQPKVVAPQTSRPNVINPSFQGQGDSPMDPNQSKSLFDQFRLKGSLAGR